MSRVWMITGAGRGLGRAFAEEAVNRGDKVIAGVRKINENDEIDNQLGKLAISIKNTFRNSQKPGWQYNTVLINNIKQEIEDNIFDFLDDNGINLPMDKLDKIEEDILMTAKSIF